MKIQLLYWFCDMISGSGNHGIVRELGSIGL
jgi:hypothetical protein